MNRLVTYHPALLLLLLLLLTQCNTLAPDTPPNTVAENAPTVTVATTAIAQTAIAQTTIAQTDATQTAVATKTAVSAATHTPTPTHTPLPAYTPIPITADAPPCDETDHDPTQWHSLWNDRRGCYYTHEHKHNPHEVNDLFGPPGAWFGGNELSYPWQTFAGADGNYATWSGDDTDLENSAKHAGYGWIVRRDIPPHSDVWISDFRLQYHAISAPLGTLTRFHSFSLEARICTQAGDSCGIIRRGGWLDFGNLQVSGAGVVTLPGEADAIEDEARRRVHFFYDDLPERLNDNNRAEFFWYGRNRPSQPPYDNVPMLMVIALATADAWSNVDADNPQALNLFCPDYQCNKNGSTIQAHVIGLTINDTNLEGFTDRYGRLAPSCTQVSLDCIPIIIENAPIARIQHRDDRDLGVFSQGTQDFDISPPGVWWIQYPN